MDELDKKAEEQTNEESRMGIIEPVEINDEMKKVGKDEAFIKGLCEKYGVEYEAFLLK